MMMRDTMMMMNWHFDLQLILDTLVYVITLIMSFYLGLGAGYVLGVLVN